VQDEDLGPVRMPNVLFRMSGTPGSIRHAGRAHGADTDQVLASIGVTAEQVAQLREHGVV
jgi:crotonobetainyl-CoA:carnitine CoA-transferase CaiB-like acyl-CoA transferase